LGAGEYADAEDWGVSNVKMYQGDCLEIMPTLEAESIDAILTDLPYETTACAWDEIIPFEPMWTQVKRVLKPRGVFVTTASQPFTSKLVMSNLDWFKYEWIWDKRLAGNPFIAKYQPLKTHEDICVFSKNGHTYNPQMIKGEIHRRGYGGKSKMWEKISIPIGDWTDEFYPRSIVEFSIGGRSRSEIVDHPTQKPVALYEYLIRTYTNEGDTVLDICAGSGTTGVAAIRTGRNAILIEKDAKYFEIMQKRIAQAQLQIRMEI
jgi:site-specific DNA-methyltransferase (adenine-specific)